MVKLVESEKSHFEKGREEQLQRQNEALQMQLAVEMKMAEIREEYIEAVEMLLGDVLDCMAR